MIISLRRSDVIKGEELLTDMRNVKPKLNFPQLELRAALDNTFSEQLDLEMAHQSVLIPQNMTEGAKAFMEKRAPHFKGR